MGKAWSFLFYSVICIASCAAHICLKTPLQRGIFPIESYNSQTTNSTYCGYDLGVTGVSWIRGGASGGVCGVSEGSPTFEAGPVLTTVRSGSSMLVQFQINQAYSHCTNSSEMVLYLSLKENPITESDFVVLNRIYPGPRVIQDYNFNVTVPEHIECEQCVFRVVYFTGSNGTGSCANAAPQYFQCADIRIAAEVEATFATLDSQAAAGIGGLVIGFLIVMSIVYEIVSHAALHAVSSRKHLTAVLNAMFRELTVLGFLAFLLFVLNVTHALSSLARLFGEEFSELLFELIHMTLFLSMVFYLSFVVLSVYISLRSAKEWVSMEDYTALRYIVVVFTCLCVCLSHYHVIRC